MGYHRFMINWDKSYEKRRKRYYSSAQMYVSWQNRRCGGTATTYRETQTAAVYNSKWRTDQH